MGLGFTTVLERIPPQLRHELLSGVLQRLRFGSYKSKGSARITMRLTIGVLQRILLAYYMSSVRVTIRGTTKVLYGILLIAVALNPMP